MKRNICINKVAGSIPAILSFSAVLFMVTACTDSFLDHQPDERTEITSVDDVHKLLMTAYPSANYSWVAELSSDNLLDNQSPHLPSSPNAKQITTYYNYSSYDRFDDQLFKFEPASMATYSDYDSPGSLWRGYYNSIASANYALQSLDKLKEQNRGEETGKAKALRAEALLIRAYNHFCLVNVFSQAWKDAERSKKDIGVPYVKEPETVSLKEYDRGTVADVYTKIGKDLEEALPMVNDAYTVAVKYHFNINAARAFAARYYLYTRQWEKVVQYADLVLGTDSASTVNMMMDYSKFGAAASSSDYGHVWQDPKLNNNLMLGVTNSLLNRRVFGYRYSLAGEKCAQVMMINTINPLWSGYIATPIAIVSGMLFSNSSKDYGFYNSKIAEQFEYTNKIAGIGFPHIIHRMFTSNELLLNRAEAKIMLSDYSGAASDLQLYWNGSCDRFSEKDKKTYSKNIKKLTQAVFDDYYASSKTAKGVVKANCFDNWDFVTSNVSPEYVIPKQAVKYMNCLNDFRRFETCFEGLRFFDIKRWGFIYKHSFGSDAVEYILDADDVRRAIEIPWESLSAGLESSRPQVSKESGSKMTMDINSLVVKNNE